MIYISTLETAAARHPFLHVMWQQLHSEVSMHQTIQTKMKLNFTELYLTKLNKSMHMDKIDHLYIYIYFLEYNTFSEKLTVLG